MAKSTIDIDDPTMNDTIRLRRLEREAAMIAQADASVAAGRMVDEAAVDAWIDSIGTDHELPVPYSTTRQSD